MLKVGDAVRYGAEGGGVVTEIVDDYRCRVRWPTRQTVMMMKSLKPDSPEPDDREAFARQ